MWRVLAKQTVQELWGHNGGYDFRNFPTWVDNKRFLHRASKLWSYIRLFSLDRRKLSGPLAIGAWTRGMRQKLHRWLVAKHGKWKHSHSCLTRQLGSLQYCEAQYPSGLLRRVGSGWEALFCGNSTSFGADRTVVVGSLQASQAHMGIVARIAFVQLQLVPPLQPDLEQDHLHTCPFQLDCCLLMFMGLPLKVTE